VKVAVISANLGGYDTPREWPEQVTEHQVTYVRLHDGNFPPRPLAMTSRLQCGIPKWFGMDFAPKDTDVIIWIDASCVPTPIAVDWFLEKLGNADIAVFAHPDRKTIREEYEFITRKLSDGNKYLTSRYKGEWLDEQFRFISEEGRPDAPLFASTAFVYRIGGYIAAQLESVFLYKARYHLHDQLALAFVLDGLKGVNVIPDNYLRCPALEYVRNKK
jgi:hypothetical protein